MTKKKTQPAQGAKRQPAQGANRRPSASAKKPQPAANNGPRNRLWIGAAVVVAVIVTAVVVLDGGAKTSSAVPAAEQKYIGRFLPQGYQEAKVAGAAPWSATVQMTDVKATASGNEISIATNDVVTDKIVYFEYVNKAGATVPMVAYAKPSGKLFVGVSYCIPCQGKRQRIEADGTLTCENCGTKRDPETLVGISGACKLYPLDELPARVSGGKIVLEKSAIDSWTPQPKDRPIGG